METTRLEVKGISVDVKKKLKVRSAELGMSYAKWIELKLSTD